ncbi:metal-dependent hydrolase [Halorientalis salina]|uniref:metal-dependent hydrolase n=1 Tax=Halorientalis salina TaxID=2932266 RepID=UPI0010AC8919|nr:metal-dependent hydrolase [Halorientalis salina]
MPDFLTHVLAVYVVLQVSAWRIDWLTRPRIVTGMAGALIPDLVKIKLFVPAYRVEPLLGVPFSWEPLHRLGGALLTALVLSLLVEASERRGVFLLLVGGLLSHLLLDAFLLRPVPYTYDLLYPLTHWRAPIFDLDLYLSSDYWPSMVTGTVALLVFGVTRRRKQ